MLSWSTCLFSLFAGSCCGSSGGNNGDVGQLVVGACSGSGDGDMTGGSGSKLGVDVGDDGHKPRIGDGEGSMPCMPGRARPEVSSGSEEPETSKVVVAVVAMLSDNVWCKKNSMNRLVGCLPGGTMGEAGWCNAVWLGSDPFDWETSELGNSTWLLREVLGWDWVGSLGVP
ncbi:hypothetical protein EI94DRAFT_1701977 [Lactarius quietus]|nr:hypothetical protein EI94DRAFT_1701977 [Lactarius quietus]